MISSVLFLLTNATSAPGRSPAAAVPASAPLRNPSLVPQRRSKFPLFFQKRTGRARGGREEAAEFCEAAAEGVRVAEDSRLWLLPADPGVSQDRGEPVEDSSLCGHLCSAARWLSFQSNLNLLRDMAVLVARDFKSRPARSQLFVFHRYGALQGKGPSGFSHVLGQLHLSDPCSGLFLKEECKQGERDVELPGIDRKPLAKPQARQAFGS